jgi:tetratricopeptide (TPR) repeat protein
VDRRRRRAAGGRTELTDLREAIGLASPGRWNRTDWQADLGGKLLQRYERSARPADLEEAVRTGRDALRFAPREHPARVRCAVVLSRALRMRFELTGVPADLDAAIEVARRAGTPYELANALHARHVHAGDRQDLDEAITVLRAALPAADDSDRPGCLSNLGLFLRTRFQVSGAQDDLEAAVSVSRAALADLPGDAAVLSNLAYALRIRAQRGGPADEAVAVARAAVAATGPRGPRLPGLLANLAAALATRFLRDRDPGDRDEALLVNDRGAALLPPGSPELAKNRANHGRYLAELSDDPDELSAAGAAWRAAVAGRTASPTVRVEAARRCGAAFARHGQWPDAAADYAEAVSLLPVLAWPGLGRASREHLMTATKELAADAAGASLWAADPEAAVVLVEHGRGVLWGQLLDLRVDLERLEEQAPELTHRLAAVRAALGVGSAE